MKKNLIKNSSGFSLIELSIVLVIVGLMVYGIYGGMELIRKSKLTATISEITNIRTSVAAFNEMYREVPGDALIAARSMGFTSPNDIGDGDGFIGSESSNAPYLEKESNLFFKHLSTSKAYVGDYGVKSSGLNASGNIVSLDEIKVGSTHPGTKLNSGYFFYAESTTLSNKYARRNRVGIMSKTGAVSARDAYELDKKVDDGLPFVGKTVSDILSL